MQGFPFPIITYQVITGNYSIYSKRKRRFRIITYQVITGNYSCPTCTDETGHNYNIPSNNRELQRFSDLRMFGYDYNIPSNNRELQPIV